MILTSSFVPGENSGAKENHVDRVGYYWLIVLFKVP